MESQPTVSLFRGWFFRIMLLVAALVGFLGTAEGTMDRMQFSLDGVPATITRAANSQKVPIEGWLNNQNDFYVKATTSDGKESLFTLFLSKGVIEKLVDGGKAEIIYVRDNPRRHLMKGDPLPPFGFGWLIFGLVFFSIFLYSLRLK